MVINKIARGGVAGAVVRWSSSLRFPYLFVLTLALFILNLFVPDAVPFADEIIMGMVAALLASVKKKPEDVNSTSNGD